MGIANLEKVRDRALPGVERSRFLEGMRQAASSVTVVTTVDGAERHGATVSAMCSVSADPPSLLVCINSVGRTARAIAASGIFCVNLLAEEQRLIAEVFAGLVRTECGPFSAGAWRTLATGAPALVGAAAAFDCRVATEVAHGTHSVFIGTVVDLAVGAGPTLAYADKDFRRVVPLPQDG